MKEKGNTILDFCLSGIQRQIAKKEKTDVTDPHSIFF